MDATNRTQERRRYPRIEVIYLASCVNTESGIQQHPITMGRVRDISAGGIKLEVYADVRAGTDVMVTMGIKDTRLEVSGSVVYSSPEAGQKRLLGVEFDKPIADLPAVLEMDEDTAT